MYIAGGLDVVGAFAWLMTQLERVSGKSALAEAMRYALRHWPGLVLFLDDGRLERDNNTVERALRPIALGRKNSLFAGSDALHLPLAAQVGLELGEHAQHVEERLAAGDP